MGSNKQSTQKAVKIGAGTKLKAIFLRKKLWRNKYTDAKVGKVDKVDSKSTDHPQDKNVKVKTLPRFKQTRKSSLCSHGKSKQYFEAKIQQAKDILHKLKGQGRAVDVEERENGVRVTGLGPTPRNSLEG